MPADTDAVTESFNEWFAKYGLVPRAAAERAFRAGWLAGSVRNVAAERQRIRQLAVENRATYRLAAMYLPFADLLDGSDG